HIQQAERQYIFIEACRGTTINAHAFMLFEFRRDFPACGIIRLAADDGDIFRVSRCHEAFGNARHIVTGGRFLRIVEFRNYPQCRWPQVITHSLLSACSNKACAASSSDGSFSHFIANSRALCEIVKNSLWPRLMQYINISCQIVLSSRLNSRPMPLASISLHDVRSLMTRPHPAAIASTNTYPKFSLSVGSTKKWASRIRPMVSLCCIEPATVTLTFGGSVSKSRSQLCQYSSSSRGP